MTGCGGCEGKGSHRRLCNKHPDYHPYLRYAVWAEAIGDGIGSNDPGLANTAYQLSGSIKAYMEEHPWRGL